MHEALCFRFQEPKTHEGMAQIGRAEKVFLRGEMIVDGGEYIGKETKGQRVLGKPFGASYR
jgi:dihydropyrimidinase